jgi:hypothetical protein
MITRHVLKWHTAPLGGELVDLSLVRPSVCTPTVVAWVFRDLT